MLQEIFLKSFISFVVVANPLGVAAYFVSLMAFADPAVARQTARKAVFVATGVLLAFAFLGQPVLEKFGITIPAFRVSGGILLFTIAYRMLFGESVPEAQSPERRALAEKADIAIFPLAIPLIAGPGCMTLSIIMMAKAKGVAENLTITAGILCAMVLTWGCLLFARTIQSRLGASGLNLVTRIMGVLLAARSVQIIAEGIQGLNLRLTGY